MKPSKNEYRTPKLVVYGNLRRLTQVKGGGGGDGSGKPSTKSSGAPS